MPFAVPMVQVSGGGGAVAAADITDSTVTGRSVLTGTAARGRAALGLEEMPLTTPGAWTLDSGVVVASSTLTATLTAGLGSARRVGACAHTRRLVGCELVAMIAYTGSPSPAADAYAEVGLNSGSRDGCHVQLRGNGQIQGSAISGGSWTNTSTASADPTGTWVRMVWPTRERCEFYCSTAVARPTSEGDWTWLGGVAIPTSAVYGTIHAGCASASGANAVATVTDLTLRGWPIV